MKRLMTLLVSALTAGVALCAARTHVALDTRTGTRYARAEEPIAFSSGWSEGVTRLVLSVDGVNVQTTDSATNGVYVWKPDLSTTRTFTLKHVTRGAVNETLEATFTTAAYDVTFAAGAHGALAAGVPATQRVPHGEAAETPEVVPATGYRFTGWSADTSRVTGNVTATALYEAIPYAITYVDLFGATHANPSTYTIEDGVTFTAPSSIPRRQFVRWVPASIAAGSIGAVTVRAVWETMLCVYVDAVKGNDAWDGSSAEQAVKTLARAYALAEAGDVILVAAGTYAPVTAKGKAVTFLGADGATIDGGGIARCVTADDDVVFQNFILQNGYDDDAGGGAYGGTFERCTICDCYSFWDGGGAYEATLRNCVIVGNTAEYGFGGGAYGGTLVGCVVTDNFAGDAGGVYAPKSLSDTTVSGNLPEDADGVYSVEFAANGGIGIMTRRIFEVGRVYKLPKCTLTPPAGKTFEGWACSNGRRYDDEMLVFDLGDVTMTAIWHELPLGGVQLWENGPYWAECNVGATKPEECGYYFWWGDTVGYKRNAANDGWVSVKDGSSFSFSSGNCPTDGKSTSELQSAGYIDSTGNLVAAHDAATAHLGAPWRMPTDAEFSELINNCTTTWETCNGVWGRRVTGKGAYSSKSIFLPAAGYGYGSLLNYLGSGGFYWSSTPNSGNSDYAWYLDFYSSYFIRYFNYRCSGRSVRPLRGFAK